MDLALLVPGMVVGAVAGRVAARRLAPRAVERLVLGVSSASALAVIARALL